MDKDLLQKHQNDPAWAEVIRLYSGLFDTQDEREDFILDLADKDISLAAECKTSSVEEEDNLKNEILKIANSEIESNNILKVLQVALEFDNVDILCKKILLLKTKAMNPFNKFHKEITDITQAQNLEN